MKNSDDLWDIPNVCINLYALYWGAFLYNGVYNQRTFKIIICKTHFLNKYIHYGLSTQVEQRSFDHRARAIKIQDYKNVTK